MSETLVMNAWPESRRAEPAEGADLALLSRITRDISAAGPLDRALAEVVGFVASAVRCDSCNIYLLEDDELVLRASQHPNPELVERSRLSPGQDIARWVAEHREPVTVARQAYEDRRFKCFNEAMQHKFEAVLSVPMVGGGRLVGVINAHSRAPHFHTPREVSLAAIVALLGGAEVERARLKIEISMLSDKLETRKVVERAKGILQRDLNLDEENAYRTLQRESQQRRKSMREIAEAVLLIENLKQRAG